MSAASNRENMDLHALCPAQSANHIIKEHLKIASFCRRKVVTSAAWLAAGLGWRSRRRVWIANEGWREDRCGWTEGLRTLVFAIPESSESPSTVATVCARRTLISAVEHCCDRPHGGRADRLRGA